MGVGKGESKTRIAGSGARVSASIEVKAVGENETKVINPDWSKYDQTVAKTQLENFGVIYLDEYKKPVDDEYEQTLRNNAKWDSRGIGQQLDKIENFYKTSKRKDKDNATYRALTGLDNTITSQLQDEDNDKKALLTYRRRVRQLLNTVTKRGK